MDTDTATPIRCLVIPGESMQLIVPSATVAEVVPMALETTSTDGSIVARMNWRGLKVPVCSFEQLLGGALPQYGRRSKVCVFYPTGGGGQRDFFAIIAMSDPRPRILGDNDIADVDDSGAGEYIQARFRLDDNAALIPDLAAIASTAHR